MTLPKRRTLIFTPPVRLQTNHSRIPGLGLCLACLLLVLLPAPISLYAAHDAWAFTEFPDNESGSESDSRYPHPERLLAGILKSAPTGIGIKRDRVIIALNDHLLNLTGYSREELFGRDARMLYPTQEEYDFIGREKYRQISEKGLGSAQTRWMRKDGKILHVLISGALLDPEDPPLGVVFTVQDITELKQSEERFKKAFRSSPAPLVISEIATGRFIEVNDQWMKMLGYPREELIGRTSKEVGIWSNPGDRDRIVAKLRDQGFFRDEPIRFITKSGEDRFALWSGEVITLEGREVLLSMLLDETERKQAEAALALRTHAFSSTLAGLIAVLLVLSVWLALSLWQRNAAAKILRESEKKYRLLFENAPVGIFQSTPDGRFLALNPESARLFGYASPAEMMEQVTDIKAQIYARPEEREQFKAYLRHHGQVRNHEVECRRRNGETFWVSMDAQARKNVDGETIYEGFLTDITVRKQAGQEREKLQSRLFQSQKMESLGILAGGVAHDFNNLLQAMSGGIELLIQGKPVDHPDAIRLQSVARSVDRAAQLTRQLLLFSRKAEPRGVLVDLNREVQETARILERTIPKMIALELRLAPEIWALYGDPAQLEQILLNLASNAMDAMPEGGKLVIETGNADLDADFVRRHPGATEGRHVLLTVTDTGCGMDKETLKHAFDPFFTTKAVGQGTGLGLASVYGIVKAHGGYIQCYSEPGLGTAFKIYLPAAALDEAGVKPSAHVDTPQGGSETILVVDDEPVILEVAKEALEMLGYRVKIAATGEEALEIYREPGQSIDLVLLDLNMPGMGGSRCLAELLQFDPDVKVVIASGYPGNGKNALSAGAKGFLGKPYHLKELTAIIRETLDARPE